MPRTVPEWIGKTDDTPVPTRVKLRILDRQGNRCAETGIKFSPQNPPEFDHIVALVNGGENRESNFQALVSEKHKAKTEADVALKSKVNRVKGKHLGLHRPRSSFQTNRAGPYKKKIGGKVERRR